MTYTRSPRRLPGTPDPNCFWRGMNDILLAGDSWDNEGAPLVVLSHGGGQTRHAWKDAGERLASRGYHVIAFDARGHGDSEWAKDGRYDDTVMAEDLRCIVSHIGKAQPVLVGASMGGISSLVAAGSGLINARALVLVDIAPQIEKEGSEKVHDFMAQGVDGFNSLEQVAASIASYQPHRRRPINLDGLAKNVRFDADGKYRWHWDPRFLVSIRNRGPRQQMLDMFARQISVPTLLVRGGLSDVLSEDGVKSFRQLCPHAEYVNVAEAGHMVAGDSNDVFGEVTLEFLARAAPLCIL